MPASSPAGGGGRAGLDSAASTEMSLLSPCLVLPSPPHPPPTAPYQSEVGAVGSGGRGWVVGRYRLGVPL